MDKIEYFEFLFFLATLVHLESLYANERERWPRGTVYFHHPQTELFDPCKSHWRHGRGRKMEQRDKRFEKFLILKS